jgi:hypothetical protein
MGLLIWALAAFIGYRTDRLRWQAAGYIAFFAILSTTASTILKQPARERLGDDVSFYWQPQIFAANVAIVAALIGTFYLIGYGIGRWRRG